MSHRESLSVKILRAHFPNVYSLEDYLQTILFKPLDVQPENNQPDAISTHLLREEDFSDYKQLISTSWVGITGVADHPRCAFGAHHPLSSMAEVRWFIIHG